MLGAIAAEAARRFGERPVVIDHDGALTYGELHQRADELGAGLHQRGIVERDVVAMVLASGGEWMIAAVALARVGAVAAGVSTVLTPTERAELVELVSPALILAGPDLVEGLPLRSNVVALAPGGRGAELAVLDGSVEQLDDDDERPVAICFTSGTTGRAKAALFRERQLRGVERIDRGADADEKWGDGAGMLASTQFAHVGMTMKLAWYLRSGATLHVMPRWRADEALELVARHRLSTLGVVAPQLALMLRSDAMQRLDVSSVQAIIAGGAPSPPAMVVEGRERFGAAYSVRYSSTESGGVGLATAFDAPPEEALESVGRPRPGVEVRVVDDHDRSLSIEEIGELQLRSDAVMDSYWNDPEATAAALSPDRWLRTGDLARLDAGGRVVLCGRRSDMYIRGGYNVFPTEVEAALGEHPGVAHVVVVPRDDDVMGETGVAVVVATDRAAPPTLESLREHAATSLSRHKLPEALILVDALPLTTAQKVDRRAAANLAT